MKSLKTAQFTNKDIIITYLKPYGILIAILEVIIVPIFHNTFYNITYSFLLIIFIAIFPAYYHTYNNRVIYQIDISEKDQCIVLHYFILYRKKRNFLFVSFILNVWLLNRSKILNLTWKSVFGEDPLLLQVSN